MKTTWEYSPETEAMRLLHCCRQMAVGFYRASNFHVLPLPNGNKNNSSEVYIPDLPYTTISRFWEKVKKINVNYFPIKVDPKLLQETEELLKTAKSSFPKYQSTKKHGVWHKTQ